MSIAIETTEFQRLVLHDVSWRSYGQILSALDERHLRMTYDRGTLEIMTLTHDRVSSAYILGRFVIALTEELELTVMSGGSTTFRRKKKQLGLEPDNCYWIAHEPLVRGKKSIDLRTDPPPDLAIEIDETHSSLDRMAIYAALGVPEVWRLAGEELAFHVLGEDRSYLRAERSAVFPLVAPGDLLRFLAMRSTLDENAVVRALRVCIRQRREPTS